MNIHEYQAKQLLKGYGAPVAEGVAIFAADEAEKAAKSLPGPLYVVKSQIHAGGRGKGKFRELSADAKGGVRLAKSVADVVANVNEMLGNTLVTKQTGEAGKQVNRLYIEDGADISRELYLSILVDRTVGRVAFVVSTEGGMDIEAVAEETPEKIVTVAIDPEAGVTDADVAKLNDALKLSGEAAEDGKKLFPILYRAFTEKDMSLLEVNPLIVMPTWSSCATPPKRTPRRSRRRNTTSPMSRSTATSAAWSTAPASPWRRWTSSSSMARSRPTSSTSAAALPRRR
jgi:succinyl-CoA synthetase beta subunit